MRTYVVAPNRNAYIKFLRERGFHGQEHPDFPMVCYGFKLAVLTPADARVIVLEGWEAHPQAEPIYAAIMMQKLEPAHSELLGIARVTQ